MLAISQTGTVADVVVSMLGVPAYMVPYAAATALTRTAKVAEKDALPAAMRASFDNPTPYTLNALRMEPATKDSLAATIMVKNKAAGVSPENFLAPEVEGGVRKRKRTEAALSYAGVLSGNRFAMPGKAMEMDAAGNVKGADVKTLLATLKKMRSKQAREYNSDGTARRGRRALKNDLFVGKPLGGNRPDGIWRREGSRRRNKIQRGDGGTRLRPLFIFTSQAPQYGKRLDFGGTVQRVARQRFRGEFEKALQAMIARGARA